MAWCHCTALYAVPHGPSPRRLTTACDFGVAFTFAFYAMSSLLALQDMDPPKLGRAAEIYEQLGRSCMEKKLLAMNAKGYWLQTGLCLLGELVFEIEYEYTSCR